MSTPKLRNLRKNFLNPGPTRKHRALAGKTPESARLTKKGFSALAEHPFGKEAPHLREVAGGRGGGVIDTLTITVPQPLTVGDVGEITAEGDLNGLSCREPGAATSKQDGVADDFETVVVNQSSSDEVLHSGDPLSVEGSCPSLDGLIIAQAGDFVNPQIHIFRKNFQRYLLQ